MVDRLTRADGGYGSSASSPQLWRCAALAIATLVSLTTTPPNGQAATILAADREWSEVEGWTVYWNTQNESCFAERAQPDGTQVLVGMLGKDNRLALGFRNNTLSFAKKDKTFKLKLRFDGRSSWDSGMVLYDFGSGPLLLGTYDGAVKFRADIAKSSKLTIQLGKKSLAAISLKGTNAVFKAVDQCRLVKGEKADKTTEVVDAEAEAEAGKLNNDAADLYDAGNYSEAEPLYRRSLAIREKVLRPEHPDIGQSLNNLAVLLRDKGDLAGAEQLHRRALTIREKALGPEHPDVGESLDNLAILLATKGDISGAEPLFRRALTNRENALGPEHPDVGSSLSDLAGLLWTKGDFAEAEPLLRRALAIFEMALGPEHRQVGTALHNLATLLGSSGDPAEAEPLFRRALAIREKVLGQDHVDVGESLNNLANLLRDMGDIAEAEKLYRRALGIDEKALGQEHANVATDINNLAILLEIKGDIAGSLSMARRAAKAGHPSRSILLGSLYAATTQPNSVTPESFVAVQRTAASETGSAVNSLALRGLVSAGQLSVQVRDEQDLTAKLSKLEGAILAEVSKEPAQRVKVIEELIRSQTTKVNAELVKVRKEIAQAFPDYAELSRPAALSLEVAQQLLADDEALVVIDIAGEKQGDDYVWAVTRSSADWKKLDTRQGDIAKSLAKLRAGLDLSHAGRASIDPALAHDLYNTLLGQVETTLAGKSHLIFVLNGAVSSLPPQVLVSKPPTSKDMRNAHWLVRDHAITVLPTVSSLKLLRAKTNIAKAEKPFIGFGDPVFDPKTEGEVRVADRAYRNFFRGGSTDVEALKAGLPRLPGTGKELRAVAKSLGAGASDVILRAAANEATVKKAKLANYNIVYFATHGLVAGEVESVGKAGAEPALALTIPDKASDLNDGLLTASEVAGLKLNADWVVLSACNTAAEGKPGAPALSGLARAFFYAGARSLLVSHWVVDDDATAELMSRTFANAAAHPERRQAEALRQAMLSIMDDTNHPNWADPGYWAAFVLVGEAK